MNPVEAQRHRQLVGLLRSSASPAEKAAALKQTSDVFEISHLGVKKWEAFRDLEVFDSLLAAVSNIDLHQPSAITLLDEALGRLKFLFVNPLSAKQILLNQRMSNSIAKYMPPILVITHSALKVVRGTQDLKLWSMQHSFISILGAIIPSQALRDKNLVSSLDRNKVLSILFSTYMAPSVEHRELPALSGTRVLSAYFKDGDFRNEAIHEILQHSAPEAIAQRCCELFERNELSREPMFLGAIHFMLGVADSTKMRRPLIEAKVHLAMVKRYWRWVGERIRHEEELCLFARSVIAATGA
ncbi:hypothetical protein FRB90_012221 [Tulasnella sp. 427]|nr:hypothetical protein FRB90_012221 [Tulasnella sp. 427]